MVSNNILIESTYFNGDLTSVKNKLNLFLKNENIEIIHINSNLLNLNNVVIFVLYKKIVNENNI